MRILKHILLLIVLTFQLFATYGFATKLTPESRGAYSSGTKLVNNTIYFTGSGSYDHDSQNGGVTPQWQWDFDYNGTFAADITTTAGTVQKIYTTPKTYTVAVKYMDNDGQWGEFSSFTITINQIKKYYYVKDHLGNIRQTLNETGGINAARDYYPYGETLREYNNGLANEKYKFNEKERDIETEFDYSIRRYYDNKLGIWLQVDPRAGKYPGVNPYNYCLNNPLRFIDPRGDTVKFKDEEIQERHNEAYNQKDGNGNYVNTAYREQYDQLHASDVVYNVVRGDLGGPNSLGTMLLGDFGTLDGKEVTITLDIARGANILGDLSHEFVHGQQFEAGLLSFAPEGGAWWTQNNSRYMEKQAYSGQQVKEKWWSSDNGSNESIIKTMYPNLPEMRNEALPPGDVRKVWQTQSLFGIQPKR